MRARRKLFVFALLCGALLVRLPAVSAAPPRIAPLAPTFSPEKAKEIVNRFHDAIAQGLKAAKIPTLRTRDVRAKSPRPCGAVACAEQARGRLGVSHVVYGRIDTVGKNYTVELRLQPGDVRVAGRCDICTLMEALGTTRKLATKLGADNRATLLATAAPAIAKKRPVAKKPAVAAKKVVKKPAVATKPPVERKPPPTPVTTPSPAASSSASAQWPLWPSLVAAGVGVVGLAVGIPLLSMDGDFTNCRGTAMPDGRNCEDRYATSGGGWAFTAMGIAGLATSGVLFYLYLRSQGERKTAQRALESPWGQVSLLPTHEGFVIHAGGTF